MALPKLPPQAALPASLVSPACALGGTRGRDYRPLPQRPPRSLPGPALGRGTKDPGLFSVASPAPQLSCQFKLGEKELHLPCVGAARVRGAEVSRRRVEPWPQARGSESRGLTFLAGVCGGGVCSERRNQRENFQMSAPRCASHLQGAVTWPRPPSETCHLGRLPLRGAEVRRRLEGHLPEEPPPYPEPFREEVGPTTLGAAWCRSAHPSTRADHSNEKCELSIDSVLGEQEQLSPHHMCVTSPFPTAIPIF